MKHTCPSSIKHILHHSLIPALASLFLTSAFAAEDPICGTWRFWDQSVREMRSDGGSGQMGRPADSRWSRLSPQGANEPVYQIKDGGGRAVETLALRNSGTQLWSVKERKAKFTAARIADADVAALQAPTKPTNPKKSAPQAAAPAAPQNPPPQAPAAAPNGRQIVFAPDWMPNRQDISREFAKSLGFYCGFAVGDAPRGQEVVPGTIIWNLQWLMPMMEAEARVPGVDRLQRDYDMVNPGFPQHNSIHIRSLAGRFVDPNTHELFNICNLICDARKQLIGVQLAATNPKMVAWLPSLVAPQDPKALPARGILEPYYDFIEVKGDASTTNDVHYQISAAGRGVTVIQTILDSHKRGVIENVRWYLTAPFARKLLDMVDGR